MQSLFKEKNSILLNFLRQFTMKIHSLKDLKAWRKTKEPKNEGRVQDSWSSRVPITKSDKAFQ